MENARKVFVTPFGVLDWDEDIPKRLRDQLVKAEAMPRRSIWQRFLFAPDHRGDAIERAEGAIVDYHASRSGFL